MWCIRAFYPCVLFLWEALSSIPPFLGNTLGQILSLCLPWSLTLNYPSTRPTEVNGTTYWAMCFYAWVRKTESDSLYLWTSWLKEKRNVNINPKFKVLALPNSDTWIARFYVVSNTTTMPFLLKKTTSSFETCMFSYLKWYIALHCPWNAPYKYCIRSLAYTS